MNWYCCPPRAQEIVLGPLRQAIETRRKALGATQMPRGTDNEDADKREKLSQEIAIMESAIEALEG